MKISHSIKISFLFFTMLFVIASCENKKQNAIPKNKNKAEIKELLKTGDFYYETGKSDSAVFYYTKANLLCNPKREYIDEYVRSLTSIADVQQRCGNFYEAETTLTKTFPYLEKTSMPKFTINVYSLMGNNYFRTSDNEKALFYQRKALKKAVSTFRKSCIISDIAFIYMRQKKYKQAIDLLAPLVRRKIRDKIDPPNTDVQYSAKLYNLGLCYLRLGNHKELALKCFNESLDLTLPTHDDYELIGNYYALYLYYKKYQNPKLKRINAQKAYDCAKRAESITNQISTLGNLIEADDAQNAKRHWAVYNRLIDSVTVSMKKSKNEFASIQYDARKDKEENLELKSQKIENELELERQKNRSFISYNVIFVSVISSLFLVIYLRMKDKKERNDIVFKSEMRISTKLQTELTKNILEILTFTKNSDFKIEENKEQFLSDLNNIYIKTRNISKENSIILTDENYENGLKEMISDFTSSHVNIIVNGLNTITWSKIDRVKKITVFRVIQEIFGNMKILDDASLISITFKNDTNTITIIYTDNGSQTYTKVSLLKKRLQNVENRIKTIKGKLNFETSLENKLKISFTFPI